MDFKNDKVIEKNEEDGVKRQRAAYLVFHDKTKEDPWDRHKDLPNFSVSNNPKSFLPLTFCSRLNQIKHFFSHYLVKRLEEGRSIICSKLLTHFKSGIATGKFLKGKRSNEIEMHTLNSNFFELACEASVLDRPVAIEKVVDNKNNVKLGSMLEEKNNNSNKFTTNFHNNFEFHNKKSMHKKIAVEPSYMESIFLIDDNTINCTESNLAMFRIRGLSESDKFKLVNAIKSDWNKENINNFVNFVTCSTDDYFIVNGTYDYNASQIRTTHEYFENQLKQTIMHRTRLVINDKSKSKYDHN